MRRDSGDAALSAQNFLFVQLTRWLNFLVFLIVPSRTELVTLFNSVAFMSELTVLWYSFVSTWNKIKMAIGNKK